MKSKRYDRETKAAIIAAAQQARAAGKSWIEALEDAKAAGYSGTEDGLYQMLRRPSAKKAAGRVGRKTKAGRRGKKAAPGAKRYDEETKGAIMAAAKAARAAGQTWGQALAAAEEAGYTGSLQGISKMVLGQTKVARKAKRGPGRPPKAKPAPTGGLSSVESMIERVVAERVKAALDKAIELLEQTKGA